MIEDEGSGPNIIMLLDELACNAWPAPIQQQLEGWKLRAAGGVTRRANSVYTPGEMPKSPGWLRKVGEFYVGQGLPVRFQVSDGSPLELGHLLDELGYSYEAQTEVQIADAATVASQNAGISGIEIVGTERLKEVWFEAFMRIEGHDPAKTEMYRAIMSAIGPAARFARVDWQGETVGVGMAVCERGWTGLFNIATAQHVRGRGVATAIMAELARWGLEKGADRMYLQVMRNNEVANRLYARLGFSYLYGYGYHYRMEPGSG